MKRITILLLCASTFGLVSCTTIGQQITNKNGTIAINQSPEPVASSVIQQKPVPVPPVQKQTPKQVVVSKPQTSPTIYEYEYKSRRVISSHIVVQ